ncbi:hypothetical protein HIO71_06420 [Chryseobacterium aquaticum]|uniref:Uncharacterized protein n=1 Tax=Chryseobacterium aquaticum TaxID=452084 RepID=A0A848N8Y2_9FLAO|nr:MULTISPECIES: hypothetical protein [Chryseobacterium]NMR33843.1 hypothetical protein [Chryseobacterium aquaticum]NRQ45919.1 hypothetical protein [Chryseobacterium sp. C-204]
MGTHLDYNQKLNVGIWSVKYLMENPNVTWENFKNQFLTSQCDKIKAKFEDPNFKAKVVAIDESSAFADDHEVGFAAKYTSTTLGSSGATYTTPTPLSANGHTVELPSGSQYFGFMHVHIDFYKGNPTIKIFSPFDVGTFLTSCVIHAKAHGNIGDAFAMVITSQGNYMLQYTLPDDDYPLTKDMVKYDWNPWYKKEMQAIQNDDGTFDQAEVERVFLRFLTEKVNIPGTELYKIDKGTGKAKKLDLDDNGSVIDTQCP